MPKKHRVAMLDCVRKVWAKKKINPNASGSKKCVPQWVLSTQKHTQLPKSQKLLQNHQFSSHPLQSPTINPKTAFKPLTAQSPRRPSINTQQYMASMTQYNSLKHQNSTLNPKFRTHTTLNTIPHQKPIQNAHNPKTYQKFQNKYTRAIIPPKTPKHTFNTPINEPKTQPTTKQTHNYIAYFFSKFLK
jgi:hypothetical protein